MLYNALKEVGTMLEKGYKLNIGSREYTVLELLGQGANTTAYLAVCKTDGLETRCILKEFSPQNADSFEQGKARFIRAGRLQNEIRQHFLLTNQTPPVSKIFEAGGTAYIDVACFGGKALGKLTGLDLLQYMQLCLTITRTAGQYHNAGYLCLDLKPENIFVMQNSPDDTITQLVEFIDFDSIKKISEITQPGLFSYTRLWAAPEQLDGFGASKTGVQTDIFTLGEIVFYLLFGRHSTDSEHRGFSKYPFDKCKKEYKLFTERPEVQRLFIQLFRGTLRSSPSNRYKGTDDLARILEKLCEVLSQKDFVVPHLPHVSPIFVGRERETQELEALLEQNGTVFLCGVGGIGKSTIVRNYIHAKKTDYDVIVYLESDGEFRSTFASDMQLQISTMRRLDGESTDEYFERKLSQFKRICAQKKVLFVVDNYNALISRELSAVCECGYDTIIVSRRQPPINSFASLEILSIADREVLMQLISLNLARQIAKDEREYFEKMIALVFGHTLVLELIARQIAAGKLDAKGACELILGSGFTRFSGEKIGNYKDGEEVYDTLSGIVSLLFDAGSMSDEEKNALKTLALADVRGLENEMLDDFIAQFFSDLSGALAALEKQGWINYDVTDGTYYVHPVIAEAAQNWDWADTFSDVRVMEVYKQLTDIYAGMDDEIQIELIVRDAERYKDKHPRHFVRAMYLSLLGTLYDVRIGGRYDPTNDEEEQQLEDFANLLLDAVDEMEQSTDEHKAKHLIQMYLDTASLLARSFPEHKKYAQVFFQKATELMSDNKFKKTDKISCYYFMTGVWFYTFAEPDLEQTIKFAGYARQIVDSAFSSALEIIDSFIIPVADSLRTHGEYADSLNALEQGAEYCRQHTDSYPYLDKLAQLLNCMLDVYYEMGEYDRCRELVTQIDELIEDHKENRIFREVDPYYREKLFPNN